MTTESDADQSLIEFTVRLTEEDWESSRNGWRCPSLEIPSATIQDIFVGGNRVDRSNYQTLKGPSVIRWIPASPPKRITVQIRLGEALSRQSETSRWKKLAIVLPVASSILVALIGAVVPLWKPGSDSFNPADWITGRVSEVDVNDQDKTVSYRLSVDPLEMANYTKKSDKNNYKFVVGIRAKSEIPDMQGDYEHAFGIYSFDGTATLAPKVTDKVFTTRCVQFVLFRINASDFVGSPLKTPFEPSRYSSVRILDTKFEGKCP